MLFFTLAWHFERLVTGRERETLQPVITDRLESARPSFKPPRCGRVMLVALGRANEASNRRPISTLRSRSSGIPRAVDDNKTMMVQRRTSEDGGGDEAERLSKKQPTRYRVGHVTHIVPEIVPGVSLKANWWDKNSAKSLN